MRYVLFDEDIGDLEGFSYYNVLSLLGGWVLVMFYSFKIGDK